MQKNPDGKNESDFSKSSFSEKNNETKNKFSENQPDSKNKISESFESFKNSDKVDTLINYAKTHTPDTIAYILLVIGIVWLFFNSFYGGLLVGLVAGFYFSQEILRIISSLDQIVEEHGLAKNLIFAGTALALFILAPGIFIGAAIMVGIKYLLKSQI